MSPWPLAQKPFVVPVPGTTDPFHLADNVGALTVSVTPDEQRQFRADLSKITIARGRYPAMPNPGFGIETSPRCGSATRSF